MGQVGRYMHPLVMTNKEDFLPPAFDVAHSLCFVIHDILVQLLKSGIEGGVFHRKITFRDDADRISLEKTDIFTWLDESGRVSDRDSILVATVFPAALTDMLHCFYEALQTSRKAKLNITYMLLRKPIQENLFLLEMIVVNRGDFANKLVFDPMKLRAEKAGGVDVHTLRVQKVLEMIGENHRFDASYIAQLRYDKSR